MKIKRIILLLLPAVFCGYAMAQTSGNNSPYSRYGFGTLADESQSFNKGMGGVALGMRNQAIINYKNPASYSAIDSLTLIFDVGASFTTAKMSYNGSSVKPQNTTVDYISAAFRLFKNLGFSVGLRPYSTIGYNFTSTQTMEDIDGFGEKTNTATYLGEGGLHLVYGGLGWAPLKNFSVGANLGYLWGDYNHQSTVSFNETTIQSLNRSYIGNVNSWMLDLGLQYTHVLDKNNSFNIGLTAGVGHHINQKATLINQKYTSSTSIGKDTVKVNNAYDIPWSYGAGVVWNHKNRWLVGFDYTCQLWKDCRFPELTTENGSDVYKVGKSTFANSQKYAVGVQYTPAENGVHMRDHINYRAGFTYSTPYYKMSGENGPKSYLVSLGIGIPIMNQYSNRSMVNLSTQYEHVAPSKGNLIKEDYFRFCVGLTFNARWFNKWKFE